MNTVRSRSPAWFGVLFASGLRLLWRRSGMLFTGIGRWLFSRDGGAFVCVLSLVLIFGGLWIANTLLPAPLAEIETDQREDAPAAVQDNLVLARIGSRPVYLEEVLEFARQEGRLGERESLTAREAIARGLVEDAIDQRLLAQAAADEGLISAPDVRARLTAARNRILSAAYLEHRLGEEVTAEAARELYQMQRSSMEAGEEIRLRELVVSDAAQAMELSAALGGGIPFDQIVRNNSIVPSAANGGDLGFMPIGDMPDAYAERVGNLSVGLYTLPFQTEAGWAIVKVEGRQRITPPSYRTLEGELMEFLRLRTIETTVNELREEAEVEMIDPDSLAAGEQENRQSGSLRN